MKRSKNNKLIYELWHSEVEGAYFFLEADGSQKEGLLDETFVMIWKVKADSYDEAQRLKHEHLGWEPYVPMEDS